MCSCQTETAAPAQPADSTGRSYVVAGMTCQSCAGKVTRAVEQVEGVTAVTVDVTAGRLTVAGPATYADIRGAVTDAGYQISAL